MFTALNTLYECKRANLESTAMRITKERDGQLRTFMPAVPVIAMAKQIAVRDLQQLAIKLHTLPAQEQERVRKVFCEERPERLSTHCRWSYYEDSHRQPKQENVLPVCILREPQDRAYPTNLSV